MADFPSLTREQAVLLAALRGVAGEDPRAGVAGDPAHVRGDIDWDEVLRQAHFHGVVGLLAVDELPGAPRAFCDELAGDVDHMLRFNLMLSAEMLRLTSLFSSHGVTVVPYKGPVFAERFYGGVGRRFFWDLDLLVSRDDVLRAKEILLRDGYRPEYTWSAAQERVELERNCEYNFDHPETATHVELHWRFVPKLTAPQHVGVGFDLDEKALRGRYVEVPFMGRTIRAIPPEEMLIIMCVHNGGKHRWDGLRSVFDVDRIVSASADFDWDHALRLCGRYEVGRLVRVGLSLGEMFFRTRVPSEVGSWIRRDRRVRTLRREYAVRMFGERSDIGEVSRENWLEDAWRYVRSLERGRDRVAHLRFILRGVLIPTEKEAAVVRLPRSWRFLYYFLRPVRLLRKYIGIYLSRNLSTRRARR